MLNTKRYITNVKYVLHYTTPGFGEYQAFSKMCSVTIIYGQHNKKYAYKTVYIV